jgi:phage virion morphogenesis protein
MIKLEFNDNGLIGLLSGLENRVKNMTPAFKNIGRYMVKRRLSWFAGEHDPDGHPWAPLKPSTYYSAFSRAGKKGSFATFVANKKILHEKLNLRKTTYVAGSDQVVVSHSKLADDYASIHQFGGWAGPGHRARIPSRRHMGVSAEDKNEIVNIITDYLLDKFT